MTVGERTIGRTDVLAASLFVILSGAKNPLGFPQHSFAANVLLDSSLRSE